MNVYVLLLGFLFAIVQCVYSMEISYETKGVERKPLLIKNHKHNLSLSNSCKASFISGPFLNLPGAIDFDICFEEEDHSKAA